MMERAPLREGPVSRRGRRRRVRLAGKVGEGKEEPSSAVWALRRSWRREAKMSGGKVSWNGRKEVT